MFNCRNHELNFGVSFVYILFFILDLQVEVIVWYCISYSVQKLILKVTTAYVRR